MHTTDTPPSASTPRTLVMAASTRHGSIHRAIARQIAHRLGTAAPVDLLDLRRYPLPLYDGDLEARDGVPAAAMALAERFATADVLVIVSPEYNGTFTPLLKNAIDWATRVDTSVLAHLRVLVAAASPGGGGGANGAAMVRQWMSNMGVDVADHSLCIAGAALTDDGDVDLDEAELMRFAGQAVRQASVA